MTRALCPARIGLIFISGTAILLQLMDAEADLRRAAANITATAQEARRVSNESARLVRMTGTRAPRTMPAASAFARNDRLFASILPASRSGTTRTFARPATGDTICLI